MKMISFLASCALVTSSFAQSEKVVHRAAVEDIEALVQQTPQFEVVGPREKRIDPRFWIEIEAEIEVETTDPSGFIPALTANWYAVLRDHTTEKSLMLTGKSEFQNIRTDTGKAFLSAYIGPDTLERFTGEEKANLSDVEAFAVVLSGPGLASEGRYAEDLYKATAKENTKWWSNWKNASKPGLIEAKKDTPFAILWTDRYPTEKQE